LRNPLVISKRSRSRAIRTDKRPKVPRSTYPRVPDRGAPARCGAWRRISITWQCSERRDASLAIYGPNSRADSSLKRRVTRMVCRPCADRSQIRQFFAPFVLDSFGRVLVREIRNVPVNCTLHCGLRNGTRARERQAVANPAGHPAPVYKQARHSGVRSSSSATTHTSSL
jgi:hypothetical protein